ncbi:MAG TPA: MFS transporter [Candidatus Dormibacteraeota bacterium]|nr:MFS transporter [Candidatus Dormibacteraeota bacterium]
MPRQAFAANPSILVLAGVGISVSISFSVLLPVAPVLLERMGPHGAAGAATAALFAGAVVGELSTPWLMSRWSASRLLIAGQLLTAVPSLVFLFPLATAWQMLAAAGLRGLGMGVAIVVAVTLVAEFAAPKRRGRAIGYFGLALTAPGIALPPIGVSLLAAGHADVAAAIAFFSALAGAALAMRLRSRWVPKPNVANDLFATLSRTHLLLLFGGFVLVSSSFGGVVTYAPVALPPEGLGSAATFLLVSGTTRAVSRWLSGVLGDHHSARLILMGGIGLTGMGAIALALHGGPLLVLVAATAFGTGFGAVQTGAYLAMMERGSSSNWSTISALWNCGIDLGAALGGVLFGVSAALYGYTNAVWIMPAVLLMSLPLVWLTGKPGSVSVEQESAAPRLT